MHNHGSKHFTSASKPGRRHTWQDGDIAFLKTCNAFSPRDYNDLIASGYLHGKATCHPVIILKAHSGGAIITPITAFSSGADNNFLPPWQQVYHRHKSLDDFRAFTGTKRPNNKHASLQLADPKMKSKLPFACLVAPISLSLEDKILTLVVLFLVPKPRASWVYLRHFWTVPNSVLGWFNKAPGLLKISKDSLAQVRQDIKQKYDSQLQDALDRLGASPAVAPTSAHAPKDPHPESYAAPVMTASCQQATGKVVMTYSKVVSGTSGPVVTQVASITWSTGEVKNQDN